MKKSLFINAGIIALSLGLAFYPLGGYQEGIVILLCINCVAAMGVSILTGFTGIFTLGHAAYMALGAYTTAILTVRYGVHWLPALLGGYMSFIQPSMFDMMKSTELTAVVVFGGLGSMTGTLLGSAAITLIMEYFRDISQYRMLIYGLLLVVIMVFRPEGLLGNREIWDFLPHRSGTHSFGKGRRS